MQDALTTELRNLREREEKQLNDIAAQKQFGVSSEARLSAMASQLDDQVQATIRLTTYRPPLSTTHRPSPSTAQSPPTSHPLLTTRRPPTAHPLVYCAERGEGGDQAADRRPPRAHHDAHGGEAAAR